MSEKSKEYKINSNILFKNFDIFFQSEKSVNNFKSLVFQLALNGKLDFQKLSSGRIKKPLQTLIGEQKVYLKKEGIPFEEKSDSVWPMVKLVDISEVSSGNSAPQNKELFKNGQYPFCRTSDVGKIHISDNFKEISDYLNNEGIKGLKLFKKNTILIPKSGASTFLNRRVILGIDSYVSSHLATIYANKELIIPNLLFNLFCSIDAKKLTSEQNYPSLKLSQIQEVKIPFPPLKVQKEIVSLMEKCSLLESQAKEKSKKQDEFSKSSMYFIAQSKNKKEMAHHWETLKNNFKDTLYSESGAKEFKSMAFQLCLNGKMNFQKLSDGQIKKSLQTLIQEQKQHLKKEGIAFEETPDSVWPMVKLVDISEVSSGNSAPQNKELFKNGQYPFCRTSDVGKIHISDNFKEISDYLNNEGIKGLKLFKKDTILIPKSGASTFLNHRVILGIDSYVSSHLATIYANKELIIPNLLFNLFCSIDAKKLTSEQNYPSLKLSQIQEVKIPLPPLEVQKEIVALMTYMENLKKQIQKEKSLSIQLSQSLFHLEKYQKIV